MKLLLLIILYIIRTMSSFKNQLQEYFQKANKPLPTYESVSEGKPHCPEWKSIVNIFIGNEIKKFVGDNMRKRVNAENSAAEKAFNELMKHKEKQDEKKIKSRENPQLEDAKYIVLIDVENMPKVTTLIFPKEWFILGFLSIYSPHYGIDIPFQTKVTKKALNNMADYHLIFEAGMICQKLKEISSENKPEFLLVSRDHFIDSLEEFIPYSTTIITSIKNLQKRLE
jgi:hypothetical protein